MARGKAKWHEFMVIQIHGYSDTHIIIAKLTGKVFAHSHNAQKLQTREIY